MRTIPRIIDVVVIEYTPDWKQLQSWRKRVYECEVGEVAVMLEGAFAEKDALRGFNEERTHVYVGRYYSDRASPTKTRGVFDSVMVESATDLGFDLCVEILEKSLIDGVI